MLRFVQQDASYHGPRSTIEVLGMVTAPVLLLRGPADPARHLVRRRGIAEHVSDPHVRELPGVGHFAPLLTPEPIAEELIRFFESVRRSALQCA